ALVDRVMKQVQVEYAGRAPRSRLRWMLGVLGAAAAAATLLVSLRAPRTGQVAAEQRTEVAIGTDAVAVLEPGAAICWKGRVVQQQKGNVFYRVERGGPFQVKLPEGEVQVLGTCFRVVAEASPGGAFRVTVSEGRVRVERNGHSLALGAGESG